MKVNLIAYTQPAGILTESEIKTPTDLIAYCARVSNPSNQMNSATSEKLIKYLIKNKHWSPLEQVDITLEIETTRDIARQMIRHGSIRPQEFSQRYQNVSALDQEMFEWSECRMQDTKNRQNSLPAADKDIQKWWDFEQKNVARYAEKIYKEALKKGIAKEVARKLLPEGLTKSKLYMKGSIRSWIHYLQVRGEGTGTQKEHMIVADEIAKVISKIFPMINELKKDDNEERGHK